MTKYEGFKVADYQRRLRILREIVSGENQQEFAERLGIPFKRWNNYERGYPVPRETAFLLIDKFRGISVEWLWFGMTGNLSEAFAEKIRVLEAQDRERIAADKALERAKAKVKDVASKRGQPVQSR